MLSSLLIREAVNDDYEATCRLLLELDDYHVEILPDVFQPMNDDARQLDRITRFIENDNAELFVAQLHTDIVGLVSVRITENPDSPMFKPDRRACIDNLVVTDRYGGEGIGKRLLARVIEWARTRKLSYVDTCVWSDNKAGTSFFQNSGFEPRYQRMQLNVDEAT